MCPAIVTQPPQVSVPSRWGATNLLSLMLALCLLGGLVEAQHGDVAVSTLAGSGSQGAVDATGISASFNRPIGCTLAEDDATLYVADEANHKIRAVHMATGAVSTLAGSGSVGAVDAIGTSASFNAPHYLALSTTGTALYVTDFFNHNLRMVNVTTGVVSTLVANFSYPTGLALSSDDTTLYVAEKHKIHKVDVATGTVSELAGSGLAGAVDATGQAASFNEPRGLALSEDGTTLYVAERVNHKIRAVNVVTGAVSTLAGSGSAGSVDATGQAASFNGPEGLAPARDGTSLYVSETVGQRIRAVDVATGVVRTLVGSGSAGAVDAIGTAASFNWPHDLALSRDGKILYVGDYGNNQIRAVR